MPSASPASVYGNDMGSSMAVGKSRVRRMAAWSISLP
ncbi:Uncharacterised protein [Bordetella pertussis]|nr:Uncharacterised protein [Bordetella pertussis]CFW03479.1 Uncharacterised protein [Bordetella pertussis]CFW34256.1 Uncharacterised protein [Bordetella pertussis]